MKTVQQRWCNYHGQFVDEGSQSEHRLASCEIEDVLIPAVDKTHCCGRYVKTSADRRHHNDVYHAGTVKK
jgi:hypothetical protein